MKIEKGGGIGLGRSVLMAWHDDDDDDDDLKSHNCLEIVGIREKYLNPYNCKHKSVLTNRNSNFEPNNCL